MDDTIIKAYTGDIEDGKLALDTEQRYQYLPAKPVPDARQRVFPATAHCESLAPFPERCATPSPYIALGLPQLTNRSANYPSFIYNMGKPKSQ